MYNDMCYIFHQPTEKVSFRIVAFRKTTGDANKTIIKLYIQRRASFSDFSQQFLST